MNIKDQFNQIITNSLNEDKTEIDLHLIEEMNELSKELLKNRRGLTNDKMGELADVYFQIKKYLTKNHLTEDYLIHLCINKTIRKFPHQLEKEQAE